MLKMNIFSFSRMISNIRTLSVSFERVDDILVEETVGVNGFELKEPIERIKLSQVNFGYGNGKSVINNFTHQFEKGKIYIFAGKNGSGKSTLLKLVRGLYTCTSGQILVNDMLVQDIHPDDKKQMMTFLCQEGSLFNDTLISNITRFDNEPDLNQVNEIIAFLKLKEHLEIESTDEFIIDDKGHNVSGGQKQLINIARFMYQRSPIILLDELTSALDVHKTELVSKLLNQIKKDHIILIATHDPEIFKVADQVCYFCGDGSITTYDADDWPQRYEIENAVVRAGVS
jgi:ABC-type bacteriocin/lantibiotic exporter with double-glycine peptidase domain